MSKQKQRGTSFEVSMLPLVRLYWPSADRLPPSGTKDKGDIGSYNMPVGLECKNYVNYGGHLSEWLTEAKRESVHAGKPVVVVIKRKGTTDPAKQYALMELGDLLETVQSVPGKDR